MPRILTLSEIEPGDLHKVGGKGLNLGLLFRAGMPVPDGFCVTASSINGNGDGEILAAYARLGAGLVAVRSSAAAEDSSEQSFAGQHETILGVLGEGPLLDAVEQCRASWDSDRARAYRANQRASSGSAGMAVVVQRLIPADVSGVLFTRDPLDPEGRQMLAEAAWGLGELVVSGRVSPDRFYIDRESFDLARQEIARKHICMTMEGIRDVEPHQQEQACLDRTQMRQLAELGQRVEQFYGGPRDIEWAFTEGRLWLLQARPVTAGGAMDREAIRRAEISGLQSKSAPAGTVWARYNLAEVLPAPTPMTWGIVRHFMSGRGGYGKMFRDLGYDPDPELDDGGFIDLVCGRPYVNLSREPKLYFHDFPYGYDFAALKGRPAGSFYPQPTVIASAATGRTWLKLPATVYRMFRAHRHMRRQMQSLAGELRQRTFPEFAAEVAKARQIDIAGLAESELLDRLEFWRARTLVEFARIALRPSMFAAAALTSLEAGLKSVLGDERAPIAARELVTGVHPDPDADLAGAVRDMAEGRLERAEFLSRFGHRGAREMELSQPRWREDPAGLPSLSSAGETSRQVVPEWPGGLRAGTSDDRWEKLLEAHPAQRDRLQRLEPDFRMACDYLGLRESAKHYLLMGYSFLREVLLELDKRLQLTGGIFFLTPEELPRLIGGESFAHVITARRKERLLALSLEAPAVLFSDDLEAIGRKQPPADGTTTWQGTPVSAGVAEGEALVLTEPPAVPPQRSGFILVCPSTDPAWVPLFLNSTGLVMEMGGILSHGAIVAREFGLPAVVGIPDVHRRVRTGQRLRVDGNSGEVHILDSEVAARFV